MQWLDEIHSLPLIDWRRTLHKHPELGYDLPKTKKMVQETLASIGLYGKECGGGLVFDIGPGNDHVILRADMDALPMEEKSGLPFASSSAIAHTCGHDLHTTMLLGAATLLYKHQSLLPGKVRILFQADEEGITGANSMIQEGAIEGNFSHAFALHVSPVMEAGTIFYLTGPLYASSDVFEIHIHGKGGHGAAPQHSHDPIWCGMQIYQQLQGLMSRERAPDERAVLSIGTFQSGSLFNVIPEKATMTGTLRTYNESFRAAMKERMQEIVTYTAKACRCTGELIFPVGVPSVSNHNIVTQSIVQTIHDLAPGVRCLEQEQPFSWSEDFGNIAQRLPSTMLTIGAQVPGHHEDLHAPNVFFNEDALSSGVLAHIGAALTSIDA